MTELREERDASALHNLMYKKDKISSIFYIAILLPDSLKEEMFD